jgi:hypothetical protein
MINDLSSIALTILASVGGLAGLLVLMTRLEPDKSAGVTRTRSGPALARDAKERR